MKKFKLLTSLLFSCSLLLSGCGGNGGLKIEFDDIVPTAYVGEEYDFSEVLVVEEGVNYTLEVYYQDYSTMQEKTLPVRDIFYFTPIELFDVAVVVKAQKGASSRTRTKIIPVAEKGDPIDEMLITGGFSGYSDTGFSKSLVTDPQYFKDQNSRSAIEVRFQGAYPYLYGGAFFGLNNFRLIDEWEDKTWTNAVLTTWIYNPTEYNLLFQMRIKDEYTGMVDVDWGASLNNEQKAEPGKWTQIVFSLLHYGVNHPLYANEEGTRRDEISMKVRWAGAPTSGEELYSFQFFADNTNIVPYSKEAFPDLDTTCVATAETLDYGWENMFVDDGISTSIAVFDRDFVNSTSEHPSLSSMILKFNKVSPSSENGYSVIYSPEGQFERQQSKIPSFRHGVLEFDINYSSNITNKKFKLIAIQKGWGRVARIDITPEMSSDTWTHVSIDLGSLIELDAITTTVRFGFGFYGINNANKNTASIHIDNMVFTQNGGTPEREGPETLNYGWENMAIDEGYSGSNQIADYDVFRNTAQHASISSLKLTFNNVTTVTDRYCITFSPEAETELRSLPNFHEGKIDFDIKFSSNVTNRAIAIRTIQKDPNWSIYAETSSIIPDVIDDNWMHVSYNFTSNPDFDPITDCVRFIIFFEGVNSGNSMTAQINIDNILFSLAG